MKCKWLMKAVVFVSVIFFIVAMGSAYASKKKPIKLRFVAMTAPKGIRATALKWWASEIEKRSDNMVEFRFFWSNALLKAPDCLEGIGRGTADIGSTWGIYHPAKTPLWTVGDVPFSHKGPWVGIKAMSDMFKTYPPMSEMLEKYNVKFLLPYVTNMTQPGSTKKPIRVPDDMKGLKIRYAGGTWAKYWQACGAVPIKLTYAEAYEAAMRGTVDIVQAYVWTLEAYKLWDVLKHFTILNAGEVCSYGITVNIDKWKSFSPELQRVFLEVSDEWLDKYSRDLLENRARIRAEAEKKGVKFYDLTDQEVALWKKKAEPFEKDWIDSLEKKGLPGKEAMERYLGLIKKYQKEVDEKGYPWQR